MSGPYVEQTGEVGGAGGAESVRGDGWDALREGVRDGRDLTQCYAMAFEVWKQHVAALVAAAEERGARTERERAQGEINELRRTIRSINDAREQDRADADNARGAW